MRESANSRGLSERSYVTVKSPVGILTLVATTIGLSELWFDKPAAREVQRAIGASSPRNAMLAQSARQLREYFAGARTRFDVPLDMSGTEFQRRAWLALLEIPFGETRTYANHASRIGRPRAVRAVGAANGRNPIAIIVPCHRLVGSDGSLTGFGGGLPAKAWLLALEREGRPPKSL
jgi:methylated-DNA-[protein]-cysteine S-methyltransferase